MGKKNRKEIDQKSINGVGRSESLTDHSKPNFNKWLLAVFSLIIVTSIVYYPSLKIPFLLDDYGKIVRNPDIKNLSNIPSRLIYPYTSSFEFHRNDPSRPLTYLTLTLNYHFNQLDPYGYHVVNIVLHLMTVLLIFKLASLLFSIIGIYNIALPFLSALLFAVHPINVNVVSYVMGRAASLATVFYLFSIIMFVRERQGIKWGMFLSAFSFIFAIASNQMALTLPAIILLIDFCFFSDRKFEHFKPNWKQHGIYWGILFVYLIVRLAFFGMLGDVEAANTYFDRKSYFLTQLVVSWKYAAMIFWPTGLSFEHLYGPLVGFSDLKVLLATVFWIILLVTITAKLSRSKPIANFLFFSVIWFLVILSPTSSIFVTTTTMAENRVYLPSIGIYLIIPFVIENALIALVPLVRFRQIILMILFGAYLLFLGNVTFDRNNLFQDPVGLWKDVIQRYPDHARAHKNLATVYMKKGEFNLATEEFKKALAIDHNDFDALNNLAVTYHKSGRYQEALKIYQEIVKEKPTYAAAHANMAMIFEDLNNIDAAIYEYQRAIRLNPRLIEALNNLANILYEKGRLQEAVTLYQSALKIDPNNDAIIKNYQRTSTYQP